ncbi:MAG: M20/M25/M40 family metallo-hydrolase, partial [Spirochaetales bacterium]|nr:M20/M25/M40 family metallo-hydrolase [Spirochaetales bacterium]
MRIDKQELAAFMVPERRLFHAHAESGFTEFWTAARIAGHLREAGYEVLIGRQIMSAEHRMGLPSPETLESCYARALEEGADPQTLEPMRGGFTAVAGVMHNGEGPVIGFRFDIDAVDVDESDSPDHLPAREGFASRHAGVMHACGHDTHIVNGLALARLLSGSKDSWRGTVKLVFQPAEEGVRGARSIAESGFLDDIDYMIA